MGGYVYMTKRLAIQLLFKIWTFISYTCFNMMVPSGNNMTLFNESSPDLYAPNVLRGRPACLLFPLR